MRTKSNNVIEAVTQFLADSKCSGQESCFCYCIFIVGYYALSDHFIMILVKMEETKLFPSPQSSGIYKTFVHMGYFPLF